MARKPARFFGAECSSIGDDIYEVVSGIDSINAVKDAFQVGMKERLPKASYSDGLCVPDGRIEL